MINQISLPNRTNVLRWLTKDRQRLQTLITLAVLILMLVGFSSQSDRFFEVTNLLNVARRISPLVIVSSAVTLVMIARGLDLSVGSIIAATSVFAAYFASSGIPLWIAYLGAISLGTLFGAINAFVIVRMRVSPIIATLGTLNIARGMAYLISSSAILVGLPESWDWIGTSYIGPIPTSVVIAAVVFIAFQVVLTKTIFGRHVYAIGGNEETARLSGVNVERQLTILYIVTGTMTALAAIVLSSRLGSGDPNIGVGFEFEVIVAIILGGTSLAGGEGRLTGTLIGAFIVGFLGNGLNLAGVEPFWQYIAQGVVLIFAMVLDRFVNNLVLSFSTSRDTSKKLHTSKQKLDASVEMQDQQVREI
ncbi:MAG: ABC transporter permease [Chloroflexi bacterium]|nr:ABC transporter permease [Chloroflexota bacterium]